MTTVSCHYESSIVNRFSFRRFVVVEQADGLPVEISGSVYGLNGDFLLPGVTCSFGNGLLVSNGEVIAKFEYTSGIFGIGESLAISNTTGEYISALRPAPKRRFILSNPEEQFAEISCSFFGAKFTTETTPDLRTEIAMLCIWVSMTRMLHS